MRIPRWSLPWIAILAPVGCEDPDLTVSDVYADLSVALCQRIGRCCTTTEIACTSGRTLDEADCRELVLLSLRRTFFLDDDAVDEGRRIVDQEAAHDCIAGTRDLDCSSVSFPRSCGEMFPGAGRAGDECLRDGDCAPGTRCTMNGPRGVCFPLQTEGEPCFEQWHCASDLYCSADGYVCRPRGDEGAECEEAPGVTENPLCAAGLSCDEETRRCVGPGGVGDPCTPGVGCQEGLICSLFDDTCIAPRPDGEPCFDSMECESGLCDLDPGPQGACAPNSAQRCDAGLGLIGVDQCA